MTLPLLTQILELTKELRPLLKETSTIMGGDKDEAQEKLGVVVDEIQKFYAVLNDEINSFLSISFIHDDEYKADVKKLLSLKNGEIIVNIENARGHCYKIKIIYKEHLERWFNRIFRKNDPKLVQIEGLFMQLTEFDNNMIAVTEELSAYLSSKASEILLLVRNEAFKEADEAVWAVETELSTQIKDINLILRELTALKNLFSIL